MTIPGPTVNGPALRSNFPQQKATEIATNTVKQYLDKDSRIKKVIFNVFKNEDLKIYSGLL